MVNVSLSREAGACSRLNCLKPLLFVMDFQSPCIKNTTSSRLWSCRAMDFHHRCRRPGPTRESGLHVSEHDRVALNIDFVFCSSYASNSKDASASAGVAALFIWGKLPLGELVNLCYDVLESRVLDIYIYIRPDDRRLR